MSAQDTFKWGIGTIDDTHFAYGCVDDGTKYNDFMCGYPVLLDSGEIQELSYTSEINGKNPRTAMGYNTESLFIVVVDGRRFDKPGMTMQELACFMQGLGCDYAINLDGGGSSRLHVNGEVFNDPTENRAVDSVLAIYLNRANDEKKEIPNVGDIVKFGGGYSYSSSVGGVSREREPSYCTLTKKVSAKYGYHLISLTGQPSVYGWVDSDNIRCLNENEKLVYTLYAKGVINDFGYWIDIVNGLKDVSLENIINLMTAFRNKL